MQSFLILHSQWTVMHQSSTSWKWNGLVNEKLEKVHVKTWTWKTPKYNRWQIPWGTQWTMNSMNTTGYFGKRTEDMAWHTLRAMLGEPFSVDFIEDMFPWSILICWMKMLQKKQQNGQSRKRSNDVNDDWKVRQSRQTSNITCISPLWS